MKQLFHIGDQQEGAADWLLLRMGERHACFAYTNEGVGRVTELRYFSVEEWDSNALSLLSGHLQRKAAKVQLALDHHPACLVPAHVSASFLSCIFPSEPEELILQEQVPGWQNSTLFTVPFSLQEWANGHFPDAGCLHQLTVMMKQVPAAPAEGSIFLDLRENDLHLLCARSGQLLLSQHYRYSAPADVLFCLLKTCRHFSLSQETVKLQLSGLIDQDSALYKELYQYFIDLEFREPQWQLPDSRLPSHFFTSLNDLALCVS